MRGVPEPGGAVALGETLVERLESRSLCARCSLGWVSRGYSAQGCLAVLSSFAGVEWRSVKAVAALAWVAA
jgi:hypothetical protein